MYELQNINQDIIKKIYDSISKAIQKDNWKNIASLSVQTAFHDVLPNFSKHELEKYIKHQLKIIMEAKDNNFIIRDFIDADEQKEVYENTYNNSIDELSKSKELKDKYNLELIYYMYDLLEYDRVIIIENEKYLHSCIYLNLYATSHIEAFEQLAIINKNKPDEKNIDIATNSSKSIKDKINFLNPMLEPAINNPFVNSKTEELQLKYISDFANESRMLARSIHELAKLKEDSDNFEINAIGALEPYINSDSHITNKDIYISWYAHTYSIYKDTKISTKQKLKFAQLSSYVIFPELRNIDKPLINEKTAIKPIREIAMFKDLRLLEFTDNRTKIKKTDDEIKFTEEFLTKVTMYFNKYS